jgi:hypothetical protein
MRIVMLVITVTLFGWGILGAISPLLNEAPAWMEIGLLMSPFALIAGLGHLYLENQRPKPWFFKKKNTH